MQQNISQAVALTQRLVQIESCNPGCYETALGEFLYGWLQETGAEVFKQAVSANRFNVLARLAGDPLQPPLVYICHMDTVPIGESWQYPPLAGEIKDGRLYGRGSCDMKAGLAACMIAFQRIAARKQKPKRSLLFIATVDEEDLMTGVEKAISEGYLDANCLVLDAEPTNHTIQMAHKGKTWFRLSAKGKTAHASTPELGADAVAMMGEIIAGVNAAVAACPPHQELGVCSATYGVIRGGLNTNIVPESCELSIDMRLVPPVTNADSVKMVQDAIARAAKRIPGTCCDCTVTAQRPALERNENSPLLSALRRATEKVTGEVAATAIFPGYTDSAVVAAMTGNVNCMSYGPGDLANAHKPNEYCACADIDRCAQVYETLANELLFHE